MPKFLILTVLVAAIATLSGSQFEKPPKAVVLIPTVVTGTA